ncbi:MAG: hypothetical protein HKN42_08735 [Granulosicoccus sp.]|nr:hypothetical protein [Granulosicoccus sp.]
MPDDHDAILLHDIRAAVVNYAGLHREVHESLQRLTEILQANGPANADASGAVTCRPTHGCEAVTAQIDEIFREDLDVCLPMLKLSSDKVSVLLARLVKETGKSRSNEQGQG